MCSISIKLTHFDKITFMFSTYRITFLVLSSKGYLHVFISKEYKKLMKSTLGSIFCYHNNKSIAPYTLFISLNYIIKDIHVYRVFIFFQTLFDPINPDKETISTQRINKKDLLDNEFWLLQKLGGVMACANFHELPRKFVENALKEHDARHGVKVKILSKQEKIRVFFSRSRL